MSDQSKHLGEHLICHSILDGKRLIDIVVANYGLPLPMTCTMLVRGLNDVYLVESSNQYYILRVARVKRYGIFDEQAYRFELDLLRFLVTRGVQVASALPRRNGDTLGSIHLPEGERYYALFTYAPGVIVSSLEPNHGYMLGQALAHFHLSANHFSSTHHRFHLDIDYLINEPLRRLALFSNIPRQDLEFLEKLSESLTMKIKNLPKDEDSYGVIHGDIWWNNIHFTDKTVTLFDFDYCGYGWRISDIASLRANARIHGYPLSPASIGAFISGYQSLRKLSHYELGVISSFEKITVIWAFGLWTASVDVLGTQWFYEKFTRVFAHLKQWIEEENELGE